MEDSSAPPLGNPASPLPSCYMFDGRWLRMHLDPHYPASRQEAPANASHSKMSLSCQWHDLTAPRSSNFLKNCFRMLSAANHYSRVVGMVFVTHKLPLIVQNKMLGIYLQSKTKNVSAEQIYILWFTKAKQNCKSHFPSPGNQDLAGCSRNLCLRSGP